MKFEHFADLNVPPFGYDQKEWDELRASPGKSVRLHNPDGSQYATLEYVDGLWEYVPLEGAKPARTPRPAPTAAGLIYFIAGGDGPVKIGFSTDLEARLSAIQACSPLRLSILATSRGTIAVEREYHRRFAAYRLHGEWFDPHPDILAEIERLNAGAQIPQGEPS